MLSSNAVNRITFANMTKQQRNYAKFGLRTLLFCVLVVASFFGGWVAHRRSMRTKLGLLEWLQDAEGDVHNQIMQMRSQEPSVLMGNSAAHQQELDRLEQLLADLLGKSKKLVHDLKVD